MGCPSKSFFVPSIRLSALVMINQLIDLMWLLLNTAATESISDLDLSWNHLRRNGAISVCRGLAVSLLTIHSHQCGIQTKLTLLGRKLRCIYMWNRDALYMFLYSYRSDRFIRHSTLATQTNWLNQNISNDFKPIWLMFFLAKVYSVVLRTTKKNL